MSLPAHVDNNSIFVASDETPSVTYRYFASQPLSPSTTTAHIEPSHSQSSLHSIVKVRRESLSR